MARGKIESGWTEDKNGVPCLEVRKRYGKLGYDEVMEYLFDHSYSSRHFVIMMSIPDQLPYDLYECKGDIWLLYPPEDALGIVQILANC